MEHFCDEEGEVGGDPDLDPVAAVQLNQRLGLRLRQPLQHTLTKLKLMNQACKKLKVEFDFFSDYLN